MKNFHIFQKPKLSAPKSCRRGFSLVELLVVIAIIASAIGLGAIAFNSTGDSNSVRGAVDIASSLSLNARAEAISLGLGAKVVIDNGTRADTRFRRMAVFRRELPTTDKPDPNWVMAGTPTSLPKGVYFLEEYSKGFTTEQFGFTLDRFNKLELVDCLVYEFNGTGQFVSNGESQSGSMIFGNATVSDAGVLDVNEATRVSMGGILLRKNGRPILFQSREQIEAQSN